MEEPIAFVEPWSVVEGHDRDAREKELVREVASGHVLFGRPARALARRHDRDDVLFEMTDSGECAVVHLTWTRARRDPPPYPLTEIHATVSSWASTAMLLDRDEFVCGE